MAMILNSLMNPMSLNIKGLFSILLYFSVFWNASANLVPVQSLGNTYVDDNTSGGPWVLLGYGANGNLGSVLTSTNGTFDSARQGSATLNSLSYARSSARLAISWNQSGKPNGGINSYAHAVAFSFADPSLLTLTAAASPAGGSGAGNWSKVSTSPSTVLLNLETLHGNPNLPATMYARRETFGVRYGGYYGFANSTTGNNQLDWGPDTQAFTTLYMGTNANGYFAGGAGGTQNGYVPSTMAIWAKMLPVAFELNATALSIAENQSAGTVVGAISAIDSDDNFTFDVSAHTSHASTAGTGGGVTVAFQVNGSWTSSESFFTTSSEGDVETKTFTTVAKPTKLRFTAGSNDAWGCWKIVFAGKTILQNPNGSAGSPSGTAPYWVDGDGSAGGSPTTQVHIFPSQSHVFSLVDGNGSTGNALFTLETNGTLKSASSLDYEVNGSHSIRVRATDELNASVEKSFTVSVTDDDSDNQAALNNGLVAWYPLDGNGSDLSSTANHGTVHGATLTADRHGSAGKALLFDGTDDYLQAPYNATVSSDSFSYSVWVKPTSTTSLHGTPLSFRGHLKGFNLYKAPSNIWSFTMGKGNGWLGINGPVITLDWTALAFTYDGTTYKAYLNGNHLSSLNQSYVKNPANPLRIGAGRCESSPTYFFKGAVDEARVWNRALSSWEIGNLYSMESTQTLPSGTTYTFTNAGATGREGPTQSQIDANYSGTNLANSVTINTRGIQEWTVPATGSYSIEAWGAQGGANGSFIGGKGARMKGKFNLAQGDVVKILVGQTGTSGGNGSGGGGGSFATKQPHDTNQSILIIAGGGGGATGSTGADGHPGRLETSGGDSNKVNPNYVHGRAADGAGGGNPTKGGTIGYGGGSGLGAGGAGFFGNGAQAPAKQGFGGISYVNGGIGGNNTDNNCYGGFGGGGAGDDYDGYGGGGGGYSGGGGGPNYGGTGNGGGGGSYNSGTDQNNTAGTNQGHGRVIITSLSGHAPANNPPSDLNSTAPLAFSENQPVGTVVGEFNATDADSGSSLSYHLVSGAGDVNNSLFTLDANGTLKTATTFDYESNASSYSIRVQVKDEHNASVAGVFSVTLLDDTNESSLPQGTTYVFTNAGATGREGPTQSQIDANYSGTNLANTVTINTRGIQEWTVPSTGNYKIEALGASGGSSSDSNRLGGKGAKIKGTFNLTEGTVLKIVVGHEGLEGTNSGNKDYGGGGGTFVMQPPYNNTPALLIAAGGGGGAAGSLSTSGNLMGNDATEATLVLVVQTVLEDQFPGGSQEPGRDF